MPLITVILRGVDRGWKMGRDVPMEIDTTLRLDAFFRLIANKKSIPKTRFVVKLPASSAGAANIPDVERNPQKQFEWENGKVGGKADWTVRRCGIFNAIVVVVEPSFPLAWLWEEQQWYEDVYMDLVAGAIRSSDDKRLTLQELALQVAKPPPLYMTLRTFLRKYPEVFHLEVNQNSCSNSGLVTVRLNAPSRSTGPEKLPSTQRRNLTNTAYDVGTLSPTVV